MTAQKITIEPVTRIEGHARITLHLNAEGEVEQSYLHVDEFRGLEKFSEGRPYLGMAPLRRRATTPPHPPPRHTRPEDDASCEAPRHALSVIRGVSSESNP